MSTEVQNNESMVKKKRTIFISVRKGEERARASEILFFFLLLAYLFNLSSMIVARGKITWHFPTE